MAEQMASSRPAFFTLADEALTGLAERHGTPLLVLDEATLRRKVQEWSQATARQPYPVRVFYATKALTLIGLLRFLHETGGFGVEAVSLGEYEAARRAGVPKEGVIYQGSPKVPQEAVAVLRQGVRAVIIDSPFEVAMLDRISTSRLPVLIRINPGWDAHTHSYLATAGEDSKFGIVPGAELRDTLEAIRTTRHLELVGFHVHVGSELRQVADYEGAYRAFAAIVAEALERTGLRHPILDVGGGIGVCYQDEATLDAETFLRVVAEHLADLSPAEVWVEPGRSIVSEAGVLLYRVLGVKDRPMLPFAFVDGGMGDNIRPALYGAQYPLRVVGGDAGRPGREYRVVGRYCESGDVIRAAAWLPELNGGELLAVGTAGAYTYAMSSHYNGIGRVPVVLWKGDHDVLWARRERVDDVLAADVG